LFGFVHFYAQIRMGVSMATYVYGYGCLAGLVGLAGWLYAGLLLAMAYL